MNLPLLRRAWAGLPGAAILESLQQTGPGGRFSIFTAEPVQCISISASATLDPFDRMESIWRTRHGGDIPPELPFSAAWIGFIAYEVGRFVEPAADWRHFSQSSELARWSLYDTFLFCDHVTGVWSMVAADLPHALTGTARPPAEARLAKLAAWLEALSDDETDAFDEPPPCHVAMRSGGWDDSPENYLHRCRRALDYIRAGDVFQVNLSRRYSAKTSLHPHELYSRLATTNPADYAAYLAPHGDLPAIASSSPELFLCKTGRDVVTRPIKGTRPRTGHALLDETARCALRDSAKDRAELNMIIDLERNDLSRVCEAGSVRVVSDGEIEALPHVFHRTATISGRLRDGCGAVDLLRATFPGGSITGAPKVRAMQIIHELEAAPRGAYCGAIGWVGLNGDLMLNLAIRTMTAHQDGTVQFHVGSGIVADSVPDEELAELNAKAVGMLAAIESRSCESEPPLPRRDLEREIHARCVIHSATINATDGAAAHV
ncbi:MAG: aminodeoxychorismate synthase, component I [Phycisphaerae bacterium]|nr:MAG: aminodeoxychorismate synthase, component I [Phycisphaerae bacterium]